MANKALFWYNYKRFVDEGTIKPLSPKTFALSGLITVCGLVLSLTIYCLVFPDSFVGENTPIKLFFCTLFYMLGTLAMIGGVYFGISLAVTRFIPDKLCNISGQCKSAVMAYGTSSIAYSVNKEFEEEINQSENPLKLAIQLAIVGNYIDCIAMPTIDDKVLNRLLMQYREIKLDDKIYKLFTNDLANSRKVIYCTDNCGEIVLDKLLIKYLTLYYPQLEIQVIVRGEEIGNDASIEDAENISMQEVAAFEGNGTTIAGTSLHLLSDELKKKFYKADMIISKGQGNYETLSGSGLNIYYLFLCKCNHLQKIFLAKFLDPIFSMECERR